MDSLRRARSWEGLGCCICGGEQAGMEKCQVSHLLTCPCQEGGKLAGSVEDAVCSDHNAAVADASPCPPPQVYLTASTVYGLEGQLTNLEDAARKISSVTAESELADLEDQVATAAAQVHHAELQVRTAAPAGLQALLLPVCTRLLSVISLSGLCRARPSAQPVPGSDGKLLVVLLSGRCSV